MVESEHLRTLEPSVKAINAQFDTILGALPGIAAKAAVVAERRPHDRLVDRRHRPAGRRRAGRRLPAQRRAARRRAASSRASGASAPPRPPGRRTSTPSPLLLTTQDQVIRTIETAANYGGSLDVILDDASEE